MGKAKDYTGQRFGRLVVIERLPQDPYTKAKYKCQCDCGKLTEQANNQRNNHLITFKGKTQTIKQWSSELGISNITLLTRLNRGWSITKALTTPTQKGV